MSLVPHLREFVNERLTAAAEEIFVIFQKAIVDYEEEIRRQRKLLDVVWKPDVKLHRIELPQQQIWKEEELLNDQQQLRVRDPDLRVRDPDLRVRDPDPPQVIPEQCTSKVCMGEELIYDQPQQHLCVRDPEDPEPCVRDPEPLQVKVEQGELCTSEEGEQLVLNPETDAFMFPTPGNVTTWECYHSEDQTLKSHNSHEAESQDLKRSEGDSGSTVAKPKRQVQHHESQIDSYNVCYPTMSTIHCCTHTGTNIFNCDICEKTFKRSSDLQRHRVIHSDEKPYSCEICGKKFRSSNHLTVHTRTHTDEKPYLCMTCGKRFRAGSALNRHKVIHTGEKPYICKSCGRAFRLGEHLRSHMRTHTDEKLYLCKTCGKRFKFMTSFKKHVRNHTGEELYLCQT